MIVKNCVYSFSKCIGRKFSTSNLTRDKYSCKLLIVGGGSGGCSVAAKFSSLFEKDKIIILEPSELHYYQPLFTLVGAGAKSLSQATRQMGDVLPKNTKWVKDKVVEFDPEKNEVITEKGNKISYNYMVVAMGIVLNWQDIPGLMEGLTVSKSGVCSNYLPQYTLRTYDEIKAFNKGNAIFTFPNTPVKCAGAPQKIAYLADAYFRKTGKRSKANVIYNTSLPVIFGVKKYAESLWKVCESRDIKVNLQTNLIEIDCANKKAIFQELKDSKKVYSIDYEMLHVCPPQGPPAPIKSNKSLADATGYLNVNKETLQHVNYCNIFGIGDCTNLPTSRTAAAVASQCGILHYNLLNVMNCKEKFVRYDGYTSCPLITDYNKCILAEFNYDLEPLETFPFNQGNESKFMYFMKANILPAVYWNLMLKGYWNGPKTMRKCLHLGTCK